LDRDPRPYIHIRRHVRLTINFVFSRNKCIIRRYLKFFLFKCLLQENKNYNSNVWAHN
jgi:hypothetical protein